MIKKKIHYNRKRVVKKILCFVLGYNLSVGIYAVVEVGADAGEGTYGFVRVRRQSVRFAGHAAGGGPFGGRPGRLACDILRERRRGPVVGSRLVRGRCQQSGRTPDHERGGKRIHREHTEGHYVGKGIFE